MASYIANNASRDSIALLLSKAEAEALRDIAHYACDNEHLPQMNNKTKSAANRAIDAIGAATNTGARRAGFFET